MALPFVPGGSTTKPTVLTEFDFTWSYFWLHFVYILNAFPKVKNFAWVFLTPVSFCQLTCLSIAAKINKNNQFTDLNTKQFIDLVAGKPVPVLVQNIVNCVPTVASNPNTEIKNVGGLEFRLDSTNQNAFKWANNLTQNAANQTTFINLSGFWSNPDYYSGAVTNLTLQVDDCSILLLSVDSQLNGTGTDSTWINARPDISGFKLGDLGKFLALRTPTGTPTTTTVKDNPSFGFTKVSTLVVTPQLIITALVMGVTSPQLGTIANQQNLKFETLAVIYNGTNWAIFLNDILSKMPNPKIVNPQQFEDDVDSEEVEEKQVNNFKSTNVKITATKIRRKVGAKVSAVTVDFSNIKTIKGKISLDEIDKAKILLGIAMLNIEKTSNILQINSNTVFKELFSVWTKSKDKVDPEFFSDQNKS